MGAAPQRGRSRTGGGIGDLQARSPRRRVRGPRAIGARFGTGRLGEALLAAPSGPTLEGARRYLAPLLFARGPKQTQLTESGVYYLALAQPDGPRGAGTVALHVADGSQVIAQRVGGRNLRIAVGSGGRERYGSCLARLTPAKLAEGYLPILRRSTSTSPARGTARSRSSPASRRRDRSSASCGSTSTRAAPDALSPFASAPRSPGSAAPARR